MARYIRSKSDCFLISVAPCVISPWDPGYLRSSGKVVNTSTGKAWTFRVSSPLKTVEVLDSWIELSSGSDPQKP
jgi:hypothetical protein